MRTKPKLPPAQWKAHYASLRRRLAKVGWISQGYVQDRGPGAGGPCYQWTRKVRGKTVTASLTVEQYQRLKAAIANQRRLTRLLSAMQKLALAAILDEAS